MLRQAIYCLSKVRPCRPCRLSIDRPSKHSSNQSKQQAMNQESKQASKQPHNFSMVLGEQAW